MLYIQTHAHTTCAERIVRLTMNIIQIIEDIRRTHLRRAESRTTLGHMRAIRKVEREGILASVSHTNAGTRKQTHILCVCVRVQDIQRLRASATQCGRTFPSKQHTIRCIHTECCCCCYTVGYLMFELLNDNGILCADDVLATKGKRTRPKY